MRGDFWLILLLIPIAVIVFGVFAGVRDTNFKETPIHTTAVQQTTSPLQQATDKLQAAITDLKVAVEEHNIALQKLNETIKVLNSKTSGGFNDRP